MSITMGWSLCIERRCWLARLSLSAKRYSHKYVGLFSRMYFAQQEFLLKRQSANLSCSSTLRLWVCCSPMMPGSIIEHGFIEHGPEAMMFHRCGQGSPRPKKYDNISSCRFVAIVTIFCEIWEISVGSGHQIAKLQIVPCSVIGRQHHFWTEKKTF